MKIGSIGQFHELVATWAVCKLKADRHCIGIGRLTETYTLLMPLVVDSPTKAIKVEDMFAAELYN